jgi:F420-dependent oxidoreductase-like protein
VGLKLAPQLTTIGELRSVWRIAGEAGFDHCWNFDHFAALASDPAGNVYEAWTLLGAMAEATSRVRIGCMVTGNTYRHPGVLAKMALTVDHLSGGRLELGLGAAWAELEHTMLGLEFRTAGWRIERLEEACQVLKLLWNEERPSFAGRHYRLQEAVASPKPAQQPWPPLWIGGTGERKLLRVVAQHADVWNLSDPGEVAAAVRLSGMLDRHCADVGRDPADIRRSVQIFVRNEAAEALAADEAYVEAGFTELVLVVMTAPAEAGALLIADQVLPRLRQLS